jgi:hypothetical protein
MISEDDKKLVHDIKVTSGLQLLGPQAGVRTRSVTFYVGAQGPFTIPFAFTDYTPEKVWEAIANEVATLRGIGAL